MNTHPYTLNNFRNLPASSKEEIAALPISDKDVLSNPDDIRVRRTNADKAIALGASKKYRTHIVVKSGDALYRMETGILGIRNEMVYTENGLTIPLACVYSVDFH